MPVSARTPRRPIVDTEGRTYADIDAWFAEIERRATLKYGPRETRYRKAEYTTKTIRPNTWSAEGDEDVDRVARETSAPAEVAR